MEDISTLREDLYTKLSLLDIALSIGDGDKMIA